MQKKGTRSMKRSFKQGLAAVLAVACVLGYSPAFAAGVHGGGGHATGGMARQGGRVPRVPLPNVPNTESRIPAPLAAPAQAPVINGPVGSSGLPPMGNGLTR
jgi:hypothetical protein